jgi:hypothetical protein
MFYRRALCKEDNDRWGTTKGIGPLTSLANVSFSRTLLHGVLHKCQSSHDRLNTGSGGCSKLWTGLFSSVSSNFRGNTMEYP